MRFSDIILLLLSMGRFENEFLNIGRSTSADAWSASRVVLYYLAWLQ